MEAGALKGKGRAGGNLRKGTGWGVVAGGVLVTPPFEHACLTRVPHHPLGAQADQLARDAAAPLRMGSLAASALTHGAAPRDVADIDAGLAALEEERGQRELAKEQAASKLVGDALMCGCVVAAESLVA